MEKIKNKIKLAVPDAVIVIDKYKRIIAFNDAAKRITGYKLKDIINKNFKILFRNSKRDIDFINSSITDDNCHINISLSITKADFTNIDVLASITPVYQTKTGHLGVIIVLRDLQEMIVLQDSMQKMNKRLVIERNLLESVFNNINEGIFTIDSNKIITSFNRVASEITGYQVEDAIGKNYLSVFNYSKKEFIEICKTILEKEKSIRNIELDIIHKKGSLTPIRLNISHLYDSEDNITGCVFSFQNISELINLTEQLKKENQYENIIGKSKRMQEIFHLMNSVAESKSTVLITGESGTGKELIARALHFNSQNKTKPFVPVNCNAFVESLLESELFGHVKGAFTGAINDKPGRFELAKDGTIFLDEIGDISPNIQVKLLRALDNREFERVGGTKTIKVEARIITATNKDLELEVNENRFRKDLFYRINVVNINLPSLRDRKDDLYPLIEYFLEKFRKQFKKNIQFLSPNALMVLQNYNWPGNIRELENVLERAFVICNSDTIRIDCLPESLWQNNKQGKLEPVTSLDESIGETEKTIIKTILKKHGGNRGRTAGELNINRSTLWRKLKKYSIK